MRGIGNAGIRRSRRVRAPRAALWTRLNGEPLDSLEDDSSLSLRRGKTSATGLLLFVLLLTRDLQLGSFSSGRPATPSPRPAHNKINTRASARTTSPSLSLSLWSPMIDVDRGDHGGQRGSEENREAYEAEDGGCAYDFGPIDRSIDRSWTTLLSPFHSSLMVGSVEGAIKSQRDSLSLALRFLPLAPWAGMGPRLTPRDARQTHPPSSLCPCVYTPRGGASLYSRHSKSSSPLLRPCRGPKL